MGKKGKKKKKWPGMQHEVEIPKDHALYKCSTDEETVSMVEKEIVTELDPRLSNEIADKSIYHDITSFLKKLETVDRFIDLELMQMQEIQEIEEVGHTSQSQRAPIKSPIIIPQTLQAPPAVSSSQKQSKTIIDIFSEKSPCREDEVEKDPESPLKAVNKESLSPDDKKVKERIDKSKAKKAYGKRKGHKTVIPDDKVTTWITASEPYFLQESSDAKINTSMQDSSSEISDKMEQSSKNKSSKQIIEAIKSPVSVTPVEPRSAEKIRLSAGRYKFGSSTKEKNKLIAKSSEKPNTDVAIGERRTVSIAPPAPRKHLFPIVAYPEGQQSNTGVKQRRQQPDIKQMIQEAFQDFKQQEKKMLAKENISVKNNGESFSPVNDTNKALRLSEITRRVNGSVSKTLNPITERFQRDLSEKLETIVKTNTPDILKQRNKPKEIKLSVEKEFEQNLKSTIENTLRSSVSRKKEDSSSDVYQALHAGFSKRMKAQVQSSKMENLTPKELSKESSKVTKKGSKKAIKTWSSTRETLFSMSKYAKKALKKLGKSYQSEIDEIIESRQSDIQLGLDCVYGGKDIDLNDLDLGEEIDHLPGLSLGTQLECTFAESMAMKKALLESLRSWQKDKSMDLLMLGKLDLSTINPGKIKLCPSIDKLVLQCEKEFSEEVFRLMNDGGLPKNEVSVYPEPRCETDAAVNRIHMQVTKYLDFLENQAQTSKQPMFLKRIRKTRKGDRRTKLRSDMSLEDEYESTTADPRKRKKIFRDGNDTDSSNEDPKKKKVPTATLR